MWKSVGWIAQHEGVTRQTANRWVHEGKYERTHRTKGGHYRVWCAPESCRIVGYCRASGDEQEADLDTQESRLRRAYPSAELKRELGDSEDFNRPVLRSVLESCLSGTAVVLVATSQDRICRIGFPIIRWLVELHGGRIEFLEEGDTAIEPADVATFVDFVIAFIGNHRRPREGSHYLQENPDIP